MSLYRNNQPSTILVNNSFSAKNSGEKVIYEKGLLFSNSGFLDRSHYALRSGEIKSNEDSYLFSEGCPKTLYATGSKILIQEEIESAALSEDNFSFFTKTRTNGINKGQNEDVFLFKNSGEYPIFNCYLTKISDKNFVLKICSGDINNTPINDKPCKTIAINDGQGQRIYLANFTSNESQIQVSPVDNLSFEDQTSYQKNNEGEWEFPQDFSLKIPLCIVDFDRESVSTIYNSNIRASNNGSSLGINGKAFTSANG